MKRVRLYSFMLIVVMLMCGPEPAAAASEPLAGSNACELIEGLPLAEDLLRRAKPFKAAFRALSRAGRDRHRLARVYRRFDRALGKLFKSAKRVFHPKGRAVNRRKAAQFLQTHVYGKTASLKIGNEGFEPSDGLRAALAYSACMSGKRDAAIIVARGATGSDRGAMAAYAGLLLLESGRVAEAHELNSQLDDMGFLGPWMRAELASDDTVRRTSHALARRRAKGPVQNAAVAAQARRFKER